MTPAKQMPERIYVWDEGRDDYCSRGWDISVENSDAEECPTIEYTRTDLTIPPEHLRVIAEALEGGISICEFGGYDPKELKKALALIPEEFR